MAAANGSCREQERPASTGSFELPADVLFWWTAEGFVALICCFGKFWCCAFCLIVVSNGWSGIWKEGSVSKGFWYLQQRGFLLNGVQGQCFAEGDILNSDVAREVNSWVELIVLVAFALVARFLMKTVSQLGSGKKPVGTTSYMGQIEHLMQCCSNVRRAEDWLKPSAILEAFESRAARLSVACAQNLTKFTNPEEGFAELSADLVEAAVAHCQLIIVSKFIEKLLQDIPGKGVREQLEALCNIYALFLLHKHQGDFLPTGCITAKQASLANDQLQSLFVQMQLLLLMHLTTLTTSLARHLAAMTEMYIRNSTRQRGKIL
ncbi:Peroxisomal acyl-coenzyme A oxidase 1 [Camellia lanceoleosa]|uniref:Peroxisomal acyl-coenzyme A oxidase 1 n=1 Tax=Camellia lanceoleosa TaxID=1840588 RepID=A0ACC0FZH6_9ERIC|nr:Peroxisomal acyl-coenzyme A oxidase 1 [Camellia lanceoleosa]